MKKALTLLLTAALLIGLCPCAYGVETKKVGVSVGQADQYLQEIEAQFETMETNSVQYELFVADAGGNGETQLKQIANLAAQRVDVLLVNPADTSVGAGLGEAAGNIPLVLFGSGLLTPMDDGYRAASAYADLAEREKACFVSADIRQAGAGLAQILAGRKRKGDANKDGVVKYVLIRGSGANADERLRTELFGVTMAGKGAQTECLEDRAGDWTREQARAICAELLAAYGGEIDAVICSHDEWALGAAEAIEQAGRVVDTDIRLLGIDGLPEALQLIREKKMTGTVIVDPDALVSLTMDAAMKALNGQDMPRYSWAEYKRVTYANVKSF